MESTEQRGGASKIDEPVKPQPLTTTSTPALNYIQRSSMITAMLYRYTRRSPVCLCVLASVVCLFGGYYWLKESGKHFFSFQSSLVKSQEVLRDVKSVCIRTRFMFLTRLLSDETSALLVCCVRVNFIRSHWINSNVALNIVSSQQCLPVVECCERDGRQRFLSPQVA